MGGVRTGGLEKGTLQDEGTRGGVGWGGGVGQLMPQTLALQIQRQGCGAFQGRLGCKVRPSPPAQKSESEIRKE